MANVAEVTSLPTEEEAALAAESSRKLAVALGEGDAARLRLVDGDEVIELPVRAIKEFVKVLEQMAKGNAVVHIPVGHMLTTQQAAEILNVSRPYLVKKIDAGDIPFTLVGRHRRIQFEDLMAYKRRVDEASQRAMEALTKEAQEQGLGY
jgi:excisionase family DNA binding protein